jgi:alpha-1,6-mannosyltransferase
MIRGIGWKLAPQSRHRRPPLQCESALSGSSAVSYSQIRMKVCDLTQFYSPFSGGVKRYVHEKIAFIQKCAPDDEHVLIIPGPKTEVVTAPQSRIYSIHSPLLSRTSRYRALLNLRKVEEILERERPDLIESSDPYQLAWKAIASGAALGIPVVAFYHSHFPEAYVRSAAKFLGRTGRDALMDFARRYVRNLYNQFAATLVPSEALASLLSDWGVTNLRIVHLGVNIEIFNPDADVTASARHALGIRFGQKLLLYVGRLAKEKNTSTLVEAFELLSSSRPNEFHLLVVGDGPQRNHLMELKSRVPNVSWVQYCSDSTQLAQYYRAADLFVHPGVQETFGLVTLESQACGTPVVGIRGTSMDRIVFHDQETWARENSPQALAEAILDSAEKPLSALGSAAAEVTETLYSWEKVFEQLFCIYREVCANYRRS